MERRSEEIEGLTATELDNIGSALPGLDNTEMKF
jgi:hypothetical protein